MKRFSKISIDDIKTIQVDSGVLLKEFDVENPVFLPENVICATSGGINPVCAPEYYDFGEDVDNAKSAKETKRIRGWNATISFTTLTTSLAAIKLALGAADISGKVLNLRQRLQYAKDFSDIWWVGKRADDKLLAIRLIRSLSDSGFSLQTNKRGKGQISVTLKGHCSFSDIKKVPMEIYVLAEVPMASLYLYGTPSTSGNIGLRVGESVTMYDGAVLSGINTLYTDEIKAEYPYCHIVQILDTYTNEFKYWQVYFDKKQPYTFYVNGFEHLIDHGFDNEVSQFYVFYSNESGTEWFAYSNGNPREYEYSSKLTNVVWANYDVLNIDGTIYRPASDPIPVSGISAYSYNGTVLPELPEGYEDYTYAYIAPWTNGRATLILSSNIEYLYDSVMNGLAADRVKPSVDWDEFKIADNSWEQVFSMGGVPTLRFEQIGWSNFDILNQNGSIYLPASDPIPVYE